MKISRNVQQSMVLLAMTLIAPASAMAQFSAYNVSPQSSFSKQLRSGYVTQSLFVRPITIENRGAYPIISAKVDGRELIASGDHLAVGERLTHYASILIGHTVRVEFGAPAMNIHLDPFAPLRLLEYYNVQAGEYLPIRDWTAEDVLTSSNAWHGFYTDSQGFIVDSSFEFFSSGRFKWTLVSPAGTITTFGDYWQDSVNTFGVFRTVGVAVDSGERDTFSLEEYGNLTIVVPITDTRGFEWQVVHAPM